MRGAAVFISAALLAGPALARPSGLTSAEILKTGFGARPLSLGSSAAAAEGADSLGWNPAGLGAVKKKSISLMYGAQVESVSDQYAAYAQPFLSGALAVSIHWMSYGKIARLDEFGSNVGSYAPRDGVYAVGWGKEMGGRWRFGAAVERVETKVVHSDSTMALSAGAGYQAGPLAISAAFSHLGPGLRLEQESVPLPRAERLDASYKWTGRTTFYGTVVRTRGASLSNGVGAEYAIPSHYGEFSLRGGYNSRSAGLNGLSGISAGFGFQRGSLSVDYAWIPLGDLGDSHRISTSLHFGGEPTAPVVVPPVQQPVAPAVVPAAAPVVVPATAPLVAPTPVSAPAPAVVPVAPQLPPAAVPASDKRGILERPKPSGGQEDLYYKAMRQYAGDDIEGAIKTLEQANAENPDDADVNEALKRLRRENKSDKKSP